MKIARKQLLVINHILYSYTTQSFHFYLNWPFIVDKYFMHRMLTQFQPSFVNINCAVKTSVANACTENNEGKVKTDGNLTPLSALYSESRSSALKGPVVIFF